MEESCWDLVKSYCEYFGLKLINEDDDEDAISFDIAKGIQEHILKVLQNAGVRFTF